MIVYLQMSRKKTREEKIKSANRIPSPITYSLRLPKNKSEKITSSNTETLLYVQSKELKKILVVSLIILGANIILYTLFATNILRLGFLGY